MTLTLKNTTLVEPPAALLSELASTAASTAGMTPTMLDRRTLRQTLQRRMAATHRTTPESYADHYRESTFEQAAFLEGILNNETSFFRDATVFAEMSRWCVQWFAYHQRPMRILSAPCSTGEEPYSIAAMLEQSGIPLDRYTIEALDLSASAIAHAQAGVYAGMALRNLPHPEQSTFLERAPRGWQVKSHFRSHIEFRQTNLLTPDTLPHQAYDLICSRNLLIYQTPEARKQVAQTLAAALRPQGRLILGAADWGRDLDVLFQLEIPVNSFALSLRQATPLQPSITAPQTTPQASTARPTKKRPITTLSDELAHITTLYRSALTAFLATNEREAERLCRQALYLDNNHLPSLELLAKIKRPNLTTRMQQAFRARLKRHRVAAEGVTR
jgi:chemotaxis protein methyltransferase WspC